MTARRIDIGVDRGPSPNAADIFLEQGRRTRSLLGRIHSLTLASVTAYDHLKQAVSARPLSPVGSTAYANVPIDPMFAGAQATHDITAGGDEPTLGWLMFSDGGEGQPRDHKNRNRIGGQPHGPTPVCFRPDVRAIDDVLSTVAPLLSSTAAVNRVGPGDISINVGTAALILRADRGDGNSQIVLVADDIVTMQSTQAEGDLKAVGRNGDGSVSTISASGILRSG